MKINLDWFIPTIFVGGVLLFGIWQYPQTFRHDLKMLLVILEIAICLYGFFFLVDKIFSFTGLVGRGIATVFLLSPIIDVYGSHRVSTGNIFIGVIFLAIYITIRTYSQKEENKKRYQEQLIMSFINEHFDVNQVTIEDNTLYPYGKKVTDKKGSKVLVYYEHNIVKQSNIS